MTNDDLKAHIYGLVGEYVDDFADNFSMVVVKALSIYNKYSPRVVSFTHLFSSTQYQFVSPYPKAVNVSSAAASPYDRLLYKSDVSSEYDPTTGILEVNVPAAYRVHAMYGYGLSDLEIADHPEFVDLVLAYYKQGVGGRRKSFTMEGLPFVSDASERYSEGKELETETKEILDANIPFYTAIQ